MILSVSVKVSQKGKEGDSDMIGFCAIYAWCAHLIC